MEYIVVWTIDCEAESPKAAAEFALEVQRDDKSIATVFEVKNKNGKLFEVDLVNE